ncbi:MULTISPECIES: Imm1 family immunity protein [unclassified Streptomyces]|uniref:Imm1 family immunity protein n=1 Tax=unclassified Streptomyces TaxID=2593676 RepID=UPI0035E00F39
MMILKVFGDDVLYLRTEAEVLAHLDTIFAPGRQAGSWLTQDFQIVSGETEDTDNVLGVGLDYDSGYGGLVWYCQGRVAEQAALAQGTEVAEYVWVSKNPDPLETDPMVMYDPGSPTFFNRISAIPFGDARLAIMEFFREGTGFRPAHAQWVKGHCTGELYEEED